jgi:hypothetical protein
MSESEGIIGEIPAELEVQPCLTEQEEDEIKRQRDQLEVQLQFAASLQADLDALRILVQNPAPPPQPRRRELWTRPGGSSQLLRETVSSGDQT